MIDRVADPSSERRALLAADFLPAGAKVLDIHCGQSAVPLFLPWACCYSGSPWNFDAKRDADATSLPVFPDATHVVVLDILDRVEDITAMLRGLRAYQLPVVLSYSPIDRGSPALPGSIHRQLTREEFIQALHAADFEITTQLAVDDRQLLFHLLPTKRTPPQPKHVLSVSAFQYANFGDRLGYHLIHGVLPGHAAVYHAAFDFNRGCQIVGVPEENLDLIIIGLGNSLFAPLLNDDLFRLLNRAPKVIGVFGTQYRHGVDRQRLAALLDRLHGWYARYEDDVMVFGQGRDNVIHLGDWMISAFPFTRANNPTTLEVGREVLSNAPLDRMIQLIQSYQRVQSSRVHPFLCSLASAAEVAYLEQREDGSGLSSGKFRSLMMDIFGRCYPERDFFSVDRDAVLRYKIKVEANVARLRQDLSLLLATD